MMLTLTKQADIYKDVIEPDLKPGNVLALLTASTSTSSRSFRRLDVDVIMIALKGPGHTRSPYIRRGSGCSDLACVYQDASGKAMDIAWHTLAVSAAAVPASSSPPSRLRPRPTCSVSRLSLCGGVCELMKAGFETLVEAGYARRTLLLRVRPRDEADR